MTAPVLSAPEEVKHQQAKEDQREHYGDPQQYLVAGAELAPYIFVILHSPAASPLAQFVRPFKHHPTASAWS